MTQSSVKVAMLIQGYYPIVGGAERQLQTLLPALKARGVEPVILTRRYADLQPFEYVDETPVYRLPIPGPKAVKAVVFIAAALNRLRVLRPDVIHCFELLSPATAGVFAKQLLGKPVLATSLRGGELGDLAKLHRKAFGQARIRALRKNIDLFTAKSQEIESEYHQNGIDESQSCFIPNGVRIDKFTPPIEGKTKLRQELGLPDVPLAVFTGRLAPEKRVDLLLQIWPQVRAALPGAELLVLGTGELAEEFKTQQVMGVRLLGLERDVSKYLQAADVFVLPSEWEGLSNSMLEAMATGLPVIMTAVGGALDLIEDGVNGRLIPVNDGEALLGALVATLSDVPASQKLGQAARELIEGQYAVEVVADRLVAKYQQLKQRGSA